VSDPWAAAGMPRKNGKTEAPAAPIFKKFRREVALVMISLFRCGYAFEDSALERRLRWITAQF
jgi:hypothetical protein